MFVASSLREPAGTLAELAEKLKLLQTLEGNLPKTEAQIHVIHEQFAVLDKYDVSVEEEVKRTPAATPNEAFLHSSDAPHDGDRLWVLPSGAGSAQRPERRVGRVPA